MRQKSFFLVFLLNCLIAMGWTILTSSPTAQGYIFGFLLGFGILSLVENDYARPILLTMRFIFYVLWKILVSNLRLAWLVIQPSKRLKKLLDPGIVAIPLTVTGDIEIIILASIITLTPGTLSVDLGENERGQRVLYVHSLQIGDAALFINEIKQDFERPILQITRGSIQDREIIEK